MKKLLLYTTAFAAIAFACNKLDNEPIQKAEDPDSGVKMITEKVIGGTVSRTKATIADADASFSWTAGDNIAVHISNGKYVYTSDAGASGASTAAATASFTVAYPDGYSRDAFAIYPCTIVDKDATNYGQSSSPLDVTLPSSYILSQVSGETSPCPMIATNTSGSGWTFKQLCGLVRLTVNEIPSTAKRLEIDFNGKKVRGEFSIASPVTPGTSVIPTSDDCDNDVITITKNGTNTTLGETDLVLNIPLPTGDYEKITVIAYDALTGGNALKGWTVAFGYTSKTTYATKKTASNCDLMSTFNFTFDNSGTLTNVRFARVFSVKNKLHNATSYGPFTASSNSDLTSPISTDLFFDKESGEQLAFQVVTNDGKVYSGIVNAPADGYGIGETYNVTANVNLYTFTISSGKQVYFSPGDLGKDGDVYSFTEPFVNWAGDVTKVTTVPSKRSWFNYDEVDNDADPGTQVYGITWRLQNYVSGAFEWNNIINRTMNDGVSPYYRVTVNGNSSCLLLPPDEATSGDIGSDITSGSVGSDYPKYLAKGFVLLMNAKKGTYNGTKKTITWSSTDYTYWSLRNSSNRYYIKWTASANPAAEWAGNQFRMHVRLVKNAN